MLQILLKTKTSFLHLNIPTKKHLTETQTTECVKTLLDYDINKVLNFHGVKACNYGCLYCVLLLQSVNMEVVRRMYLALVLFSLLKETNLWNVADRFQLSRGFIQTLLSSSSAFCSCVLHFTEVSTQLRSAIN